MYSLYTLHRASLRTENVHNILVNRPTRTSCFGVQIQPGNITPNLLENQQNRTKYDRQVLTVGENGLHMPT